LHRGEAYSLGWPVTWDNTFLPIFPLKKFYTRRVKGHTRFVGKYGRVSDPIKYIYILDQDHYPDQEYIYFMGSETLPSACYILSDESSIPFTLRVTGIKTKKKNWFSCTKVLAHLCFW